MGLNALQLQAQVPGIPNLISSCIGFSVYEARAILWLCLKEELGSDCEFFSPIQSKSTQADLLAIINKKPKDKEKLDNVLLCVYPNPSNGNITLDCIGDQPLRLEVYSLDGRLLFQTHNASKNIFLGNLSNGLYFYSIRSHSLLVESGKLVIINQ